MRLIDADALIEKMKETSRFFDVVYDIEEMPTIETVARHGHWIRVVDNNGQHQVCEFCGEWKYHTNQKFCGECGAKMDGKEDQQE